MPQRNLLILLAMVVVSYACYVRGEQNPYARYVSSGLDAIEESALEKVPDGELFDAAMHAMVDVLRRHGDSHSEFLTRQDTDPFWAEIRQQFGGIGVRIRFVGKPPRLVIAAPPDPGSPAARANLLAADQIVAIDDLATEDMTMADVLRRMRGEPGTSVKLAVRQERDGELRTLVLVREVVNIESILGDVRAADGRWQFALESDPRIAHVRIASFGNRTADELAAVLQEATARGVRAVVLDLRDNPGGALDAAVAVCDLFLPAGKTIVETRGRDQQLRQRYRTNNGEKPFLKLPLAVIVNQNSASAAEIVAACLQDYGRAVVVGQRSFGKGTVQLPLPMESGKSLLKLTWASFWRPSGVNIHRKAKAPESDRWGVSPDTGYEVPLAPEEYAIYRKYRFERDMLDQEAYSQLAAGDESDGLPVPEDFVDRQLEAAVSGLRAILSDPPH